MLALLVSTVGCGHSLERETAEWERVKRQAAEVLRKQSDPDSLAAAALLTARSAPADALTLISAAVAAAPTRPELVFLQIEICAETAGCDPRPIELRLRELEPENTIGWFGELTRAFDAGDPMSLDAALAAAGSTHRADSHFTVLTAHLGRAAMDAKVPSPQEAANAVLGELGSFGLPNHVAASKACGPERLDRGGVRDACRSLAAALMAGDTVLAEMIGVVIAKRAWPPDSQHWQAASEARRTHQYRVEALKETAWFAEPDEIMTTNYLDLLAQHRREQDAMIAQLIAAGIDPNPPATWVDKSLP